tara:strand:- start:312 stop:1187 length:876 start_codon:yes stop_codon:yes gene_type:complete
MPKIKTKARKGQIKGTLNYISREAHEKEHGNHNLISSPDDLKGIENEMENNASERGSRRFYHDQVSFHPKDREKCTKEFMRDFSEEYVSRVYPNQQVHWCVHRDKKHVHVHLCVSATGLDGKKLHIGVKDVSRQDRFVQEYARERGLHAMDRLELKMEKGKSKLKEAKKERDLKSDKEIIREKIGRIINDPTVDTGMDFKRGLEKEGLSLSKRKTGVIYDKKTYRFKTLGYDKDCYIRGKFDNHRSDRVRDIIKDKKKEIQIEKKLKNILKPEKELDKAMKIKEQEKGLER